MKNIIEKTVLKFVQKHRDWLFGAGIDLKANVVVLANGNCFVGLRLDSLSVKSRFVESSWSYPVNDLGHLESDQNYINSQCREVLREMLRRFMAVL